jgi:hypothetical protein
MLPVPWASLILTAACEVVLYKDIIYLTVTGV